MGTPEADDHFVRFFMQHVVALNQAWDQPGTSTRQHNAYTCFVLEMWDQWFLVTAGHVLLNHLYDPDRKNVVCTIFDAWKKGTSQLPTPFLLPEVRLALDEDGLDLGLIPIDPFYRRQLAANGIKAFDERVSRPLPTDMLKYVVVGLPDQFITRRPTATGNVELLVSPTIVPLDAVDPPPGMSTPFPRFYGKIAGPRRNEHTGVSLDEMSGFSGGPILGFRANENGQMHYYLVAIQSGWRRDLRVVAGPLMPAIANWIETRLRAE